MKIYIHLVIISVGLSFILSNFLFLSWMFLYETEYFLNLAVMHSSNNESVSNNVLNVNKPIKFFLELLKWDPLSEVQPILQCSMDSCFDYSLCETDFKVYVYPSDQQPTSSTYSKILTALRNSKLITTNPYEACIFIPSLDTLDRDPLSPHFASSLAQQLTKLPFWHCLPKRSISTCIETSGDHPGRNHLLFNLYAGTWPNYHEEEYRMWFGEAILAKASFSTTYFRRGFDISIPLIHPNHPGRVGLISSDKNSMKLENPAHLRLFLNQSYFLSFKGKRYVSGIGSASRNSLFHLHNGKDIIMLTTCRHGTDWARYADKRCPIDMALYDGYDYDDLMYNSTFCLVPRGRRLGSYRFLEVLRAGCIPVLLSNDLELPFSEVIDWRQAVVWADERLPLLLPLTLRRLSLYQIIRLRQQGMFLWHTYFSSVESIVLTTLETLRDRVSVKPRSYSLWNSFPGGLVFSSLTSIDDCDIPRTQFSFYCKSQSSAGFTLLIPIREKLCSVYLTRLEIFKTTLFDSKAIKKVLIVWQCNDLPKSNDYLSSFFSAPLEVILPDERHNIQDPFSSPPSIRFQPLDEVSSLAIFTFTLNLNITKEDVEFAYKVWQEFPHRLVGFDAASHYYSHKDQMWRYTYEDISDNFSMILLNAGFYHRYYHQFYWNYLTPMLHEIVNTFSNCEDILLNCLISDLTHLPPIKLYDSKQIWNLRWPLNDSMKNDKVNQISVRSLCIQAFSQHFTKPPYTGIISPQKLINDEPELYLPLYHSTISLHPSKQ